jgi:hypothetical protein
LWGHNIVAGALSVVTKKPTNDMRAQARVTLGSFDRLVIDGYVSGPIVQDRLFGQISSSSERADGYMRNLETGGRLNSTDIQSVRGKLVLAPTKMTEFTLSGSYMLNRSSATASALIVGSPSSYYEVSTDPFTYQQPTACTISTAPTAVAAVRMNRIRGARDRRRAELQHHPGAAS